MKNNNKILTFKNESAIITKYEKNYIFKERKLKMKILGEKSLSSKVIVGLKTLFVAISVLDIVVLTLMMKTINHIVHNESLQSNIFDLNLFGMLILSGIIALLIIYQFIKIFKNIKNNVLFSKDNSNCLNIISNSSLTISVVFCIISILVFFLMCKLEERFIHFVFAFAIILAVVFVAFGIGIKVLNEIYKKAIEYKEENDFII